MPKTDCGKDLSEFATCDNHCWGEQWKVCLNKRKEYLYYDLIDQCQKPKQLSSALRNDENEQKL